MTVTARRLPQFIEGWMAHTRFKHCVGPAGLPSRRVLAVARLQHCAGFSACVGTHQSSPIARLTRIDAISYEPYARCVPAFDQSAKAGELKPSLRASPTTCAMIHRYAFPQSRRSIRSELGSTP